jgi:hypothetical protein
VFYWLGELRGIGLGVRSRTARHLRHVYFESVPRLSGLRGTLTLRMRGVLPSWNTGRSSRKSTEVYVAMRGRGGYARAQLIENGVDQAGWRDVCMDMGEQRRGVAS